MIINGYQVIETDCMLNTKDLKTYKGNSKEHTREQIEHIKESIKEFGMSDPIGIWGEQNEIVEGHGRLIACKELGIDKVPCIRLDHMSDEERRAYGIVHNSTNMETGFDERMLDKELADIDNIDMSVFGLGKDEEEIEDGYEKPEVEFTEELLLTHNYIVLYFDNEFDWNTALDKFKLKEVKDLIPRKNQPTGIGRVIKGAEVLKWLN